MSTATANKPKLVENIQVLQVGKYGVRVDEKTWYGVNEPLTPANFSANNGYKVSVVVSKTNKKYIAEILGVESTEAAAPVAEAPKASAPAPVAAPKAEAKTEAMPSKDRSQMIGGLSHDAATIVAVMVRVNGYTDTKEILKNYKEVLEGLLNVREGLK